MQYITIYDIVNIYHERKILFADDILSKHVQNSKIDFLQNLILNKQNHYLCLHSCKLSTKNILHVCHQSTS